MTTQQFIAVGAALLSAAGILLMYKNSVSAGPFGYVNAEMIADIRRAGVRRQKGLRVGLALSMLGIAVGCASAFVGPSNQPQPVQGIPSAYDNQHHGRD